MMNATLAFCILALTSSAVPPFLLIVLPRYVNESVSSSGSPFNVMGLLFFVLAFIIFVLLLLMLSLNCVDSVFSSSVFSCIWLCERRARSSARSRSSNWLQLDPISSVFCFMNTNCDKDIIASLLASP
ncbi:hypothetical protein NP493_150g03006 [Ridgeia piscesae]|uniref:Uncharacterized protein n=1 Tax=Ridgeia piscesae TaxID=27915 RepID=A0AAD9P4D7_RIDPI|nr:hypothetical protein NP493_150g03006 [Ridgeia piscesae]